MAPRLLSIIAVIGGIQDFRGAPIPGLPGGGVGHSTMPSNFERQLERLRQLQQQLQTSPAAAAARARAAHPTGIPARIFHQPFVAPGRGSDARPAAPSTVTAANAHGQRPASAAKRALASQIHAASHDAGVDPNVAVAVARAESSLNPKAVSPDGISVGAFQVTWDTKAEMRNKFAAGTVERPSGTDDVAMGVGYLRYLHDLFGRGADLGRGKVVQPVGNASERQRFVTAAYNAGEGAVARAQQRAAAAGKDPTAYADIRPYLPAITQTYVDRVSRYANEERVQPTVLS